MSKKKNDNERDETMLRKSKIASLNELMDVDAIHQDHIVLKDGYIMAGIKIEPKDLLVLPDDEARLILSRIKNVLDTLLFEVDWGFVFVPNDYSYLENMLRKQYAEDDTSVYQRRIIEADIQKLNAFAHSQYKLTFHATLQGKQDTVLKNLEILYEEMKRALPCSILRQEDYLQQINHVFDTSSYEITQGNFKGDQTL